MSSAQSYLSAQSYPSAPSSPSADASHLRVDGLSHSYGAHRVLTDISFTVAAGTPTGLLGENGSGKSTLLRLIAGVETPDSGTVTAPGPIGLLAQELPHDPATTALGDVVAEALARARRLEEALAVAAAALAEQPDSADRAAAYDAALRDAELAEVWEAPGRAEEILAGLGLADVEPQRLLGQMSGGQRGRLALAHLLIARPATMLLDEPTNHLDDAGAEFLARLLTGHRGVVLAASHDRAFLDEATRAQVDLDPGAGPVTGSGGGATAYTGTFSDYLLARLDARERWERQFRLEQEELTALREQVQASHSVGHEGRGPRTEARGAKKFYSDRNATVVSRRVRDAQRRVAELERTQVRKPPAELHLTNLPRRDRPGSGVQLAVAEAEVRNRLAPVSCSLSAGEKLLVTGVNGSGKSTLLDVMTGRLAPDAGSVQRSRSLRIGHLSQHESVDPGATARALLNAALGRSPEEDGVVETFGLIHPRDLDRPLGELSRGQVRRVALAAVLADPPDLLVLDEPTNHLALDVATRLERALQEWPGIAVIASHDRWLRRRWQGRTLALG